MSENITTDSVIQAVVKRRVRQLVQQEREDLMRKYDTPATYDDPFGGMTSETLDHIQQLLVQYEKTTTVVVTNLVWQRLVLVLEDACGFNSV